LKQSRSAGIMVVTEFRGNPMLATAQVLLSRCPELREVIPFDRWDAFLESGDIAKPELPKVRSTDPVMIQYTSGTTGFPKGALLHHRGLVNNGAHTADRAGIADGAVQVTTMPLFHTGGCVCCVLGAISRRATQVLVEAFDPGLVIELLDTYRGNAMLGVPTMLVAMMEHPSFATADLSSINAIYSGGSTVPASIVTALEQWLGAAFTIVFGQTECSPVALMTWATDSITDKAETIGSPMPNVEVKIVHPDTGETVPIGEIGEICTRGYHIMHGYFENEAATVAAIDTDGWLHTGDLGAMDDRGYCTVEGRLKDMIIRGAKTSTRVNSRNCCSAIQRSETLPWSDCPTRDGAKSYRRSSVPRRATRSTRTNCMTISASISPRTRLRATGSWSRPCRSPAPARFKSSSCASNGRRAR
jgi:fatty-acyl-CoA synthase